MSSVRLAALVALVGASLWSAGVNAQVFRIVGPDGRVTFTDRPPPDAKATPASTMPLGGGGSSTAGLPVELRNASSRFPVTLYTGVDCQPCMSARAYLANRGIPYSEKTVTTPEDIQALQRIMGEARLPFATIGGQHVRGFSEPEWSQYLDAAGYPKVSQLPPSFRNPVPSPLVAVQARPPAQTQQEQQPAQAPQAEAPTPSTPSPSNPLGIRF